MIKDILFHIYKIETSFKLFLMNKIELDSKIQNQLMTLIKYMKKERDIKNESICGLGMNLEMHTGLKFCNVQIILIYRNDREIVIKVEDLLHSKTFEEKKIYNINDKKLVQELINILIQIKNNNVFEMIKHIENSWNSQNN